MSITQGIAVDLCNILHEGCLCIHVSKLQFISEPLNICIFTINTVQGVSRNMRNKGRQGNNSAFLVLFNN